MRDATKVVIGFGSIWGLFAMGALLFTSFSLGDDDSLPEVIDLVLYGATILPHVWEQSGGDASRLYGSLH